MNEEKGGELRLRISSDTDIEGIADRTQFKIGQIVTAHYQVPENFNPALGYDVIPLLFPLAAVAQFDTGSITGLVKDATGSAVPGARITLADAATGVNFTTTSNESGSYEFPNVRAGTYKITAERTGFSQAVADHVVVNVASRLEQSNSVTSRNCHVVFENGRKAKAADDAKDTKIQQLEAKLTRKNEVMAELMEAHTELKKSLGEL